MDQIDTIKESIEADRINTMEALIAVISAAILVLTLSACAKFESNTYSVVNQVINQLVNK